MKWCCFLLLFLPFYYYAQNYSFLEYSTSEGLPQSQVNAIEQDEEGYLWIATFGGLARFDGTSFLTYGKSSGLLNNRAVHLNIIDDTLFIGHDKGISYQYKSDTFCYAKFPPHLPPANVTSILKYGKKILVMTNGNGLLELNKATQQLNVINNSPERIRGGVMKNKDILLATRNGIQRYNSGKFETIPHTKNTSFSSVHLLRDSILATTYDGSLLHVKYSGQIDTIYRQQNTPFRSMITDPFGNFWLNSREGAVCLEKDTILRLTESTGLPINDINTIFIDRERNYWLGTGGKGLIRFTGETFNYYSKKNGWPSNLVISIIKDKNDDRWISTYDKGIFRVSKNEEIKPIDYIPSSVWSMDYSEEGIVFGSNFGLFYYDYNQWYSFYEEDGLPANRIRGVKAINDSTFYIGTAEAPVAFNLNQRQITPLTAQNDLGRNVRDFIQQEDALFMASQEGVIELKNGKTKNIAAFEAGVNCIEQDPRGKLWAGTENGLYIQDEDTFKRKILQRKTGNDYVNFIQHIDTVFFVGTNSGMYELSESGAIIHHYSINEGLVDLETNLNAHYYDKNRDIFWFGTASGLMKMHLQKRHLLYTSAPPKINLTGIHINFKPIPNSRLQAIKSTTEGQLQIAYKNNDVQFNFDVLFLTHPDDLQYQYRLEGFSEKWSPLSENPTVNFTNLPLGNYTLHFRATNQIGKQSSSFKTAIEVLPPFYRTWWFYSIMVLLAGLIVYALDRVRVAQLRRKNYRLQLEFKNKLTKLEQQSLNASMNRHFIFNSLNSIQYYINSSDKKSANKYLSRFAKLIRKNLDSSHRKDGMVALGDELERLQLYLDLESMRFQNKINYSINVGANVEIELLKVPAMFLQPFVENSIIHGILPLKKRKGQITINITDHLDHIRIEICDNGVGIEQSVKKKHPETGDHESQGMLITKGRIDLLQKISARSIEMIGPQQLYNEDGSVKGTLVIFKLIKQYLE